MSKIHVLPGDVANKIAAGEVVERPASVVKELVENAVDAGATAVTIEIENGGISLIRVTDNGCGMELEDAQCAFLRHATSKIQSADDLEHIQSLGFRGEALASIAAVSKIELRTKTAQTDGIYLYVEAGEVLKSAPEGCANGTSIAVKELFYNTPARMKFLKKNHVEAGYVADIVERLVLSTPALSVRFLVDGKERLFSDGSGTLEHCIYSVYGKEHAMNALPFDQTRNGIRVWGVAGRADLSRGNRSFQSFFVNGRYVKPKTLTFVAEGAYKNILMTGKFPFFVVNIELAPELVDINVHPTKQEVKFANEKVVGDAVYWAIKNALEKDADRFRNQLKSVKQENFTLEAPTQPIPAEPEDPEMASDYTSMFIPLSSLQSDFPKEEPAPPSRAKEPVVEAVELPLVLAPVEQSAEPPAKEYTYRYIGQIFETYLIIEMGTNLYLIDQHAAHERMIYERLLKQKQEGQVTAQLLLSPCAITLSPSEYAFVKDRQADFAAMGFAFDDFGNNAILIRQAPVSVGGGDLEGLLFDLIEKMEAGGQQMLPESEAEALHMIACKAAIKANMKMSQAEVKALIEDVLRTDGVNTCPHGRPLMIQMTKREIEKLFKRIV